MLDAIRKPLALPRPLAGWALPTLTVAAFLWLLVQDAIAPVAIVLLQLYLSF